MAARRKKPNSNHVRNSDSGSGSKNPLESARRDAAKKEPYALERFFKILGPGLITGASDDDPSGIGTYATAGAQLGYVPLWTALFTFPLMAAIQFICAKIGMVTGRGLAGVLRHHYPRAVLYSAVLGLVVANTINAGADIAAIAAGFNLLLPIPVNAWIVPVGIVLLLLQVWGSYRLIADIFKWLTISLFAYVGAAFLAGPHWTEVLKSTVIPSFRLDSAFLATLVAILGTTISPYLFFWQTNQEVEEEIAIGHKRLWQRQGTTSADLRYAMWDVNIGMFFSNVVMYFIILATAATLHGHGKTNIDTAADAAMALRPLAGNAAFILMALGLIGTGLLAVPILTTSGAYAVCESLGWKWGLDRSWRGAKHFYFVIGASTVVGLCINFIGINPIDALFGSAVVNGFLAPPLLIIVMLIANNQSVMGKWVNGRSINVLGWLTTVVMFAAAIGLVLTWNSSS